MSFPSRIIKGEELGVELKSSCLSDTGALQVLSSDLISITCYTSPCPLGPGSRTEHLLRLRQLCCQTVYPAPLPSIIPALCSQGIHAKNPAPQASTPACPGKHISTDRVAKIRRPRETRGQIWRYSLFLTPTGYIPSQLDFLNRLGTVGFPTEWFFASRKEC